MTAADLYDFESGVANSAAVAFTSAGLNVATITLAPNIQKPRPRSEITFRPGGAIKPCRILLISGKRRIAAYTGELEIVSITDASGTGKQTHALYRGQIRQLMELDEFRAVVNINTSPYNIDFIYATGSGETLATKDGYEISRLTYAVDFSIKADAFTQLNSQ